jgi:XTP/dITP diphosphohydrolase
MDEHCILVATGNTYKVEELRSLLGDHPVRLLCARDVGGFTEVVEDGRTFEENAVKKAGQVAAEKQMRTLADDSGLEVDALGGAPGINSARFAGEHGNDKRNIRKLLDLLRHRQDRRARFVCAVAVADPHGQVRVVRGEIKGWIAEEPRGSGGFGYDPVFVPEGADVTFAELPEEEKNRISHRAEAVREALRTGLL